MNRLYAVILLLLLSTLAFSQDKQNMKVEQTKEAAYPNGDQALFTYIFNNLKYSPEAKAAKVEGEIMASVMVELDSSVTTVKIIRDLGYGIGADVKALLEKLKYGPALENGTAMRSKVILNIPVRAH
jgi:protein TonB